MDTPRRWQVASLATAVAGLSFGAVMMGRAPSEAVPAIELEVHTDAGHVLEAPGRQGGSGSGLELVPPSVLEDPTPPSPDSVASVEEPAPTTSEPSRTEPAPPAEPDSPESVDSPDSVDSDD